MSLYQRTVFAEWFTGKAEAQAALRILNRHGLLLTTEGKTIRPDSLGINNATTFEKLDGKSMRWIQFLDPIKHNDAGDRKRVRNSA